MASLAACGRVGYDGLPPADGPCDPDINRDGVVGIAFGNTGVNSECCSRCVDCDATDESYACGPTS